MKINFELSIGPETAFVSSALENQIAMMAEVVAASRSPHSKEQAQVFVDVGNRLNRQLEETIQKAIPFNFPKA